MVIYISGKISGLPEESSRATFQAAEDFLLSLGYTVINPKKLHPVTHGKWSRYMAVDIDALYKADAIYMLNDWEGSVGADLEFEIAFYKNMPVYFQKIGVPSLHAKKATTQKATARIITLTPRNAA